jgi:hypothetical protein
MSGEDGYPGKKILIFAQVLIKFVGRYGQRLIDADDGLFSERDS